MKPALLEEWATVQNPKPYLLRVESIAEDTDAAAYLASSYCHLLKDYKGNIFTPDPNDAPEIYLAKASLAYLCDTLDHHLQFSEVDHESNIVAWLRSAGKVWTINDAVTNTLTQALNRSQSHASAELDSRLNALTMELTP